MNTIWFISIFIILITVLVLIYIRLNNIIIDNEYKYLAGSIGLSGFIFSVMGEGLFIE
tara:strand:+ start:2110 stop:2283 length:174 start_codon:yes stop_codon:yes gene_type:complete